MHCGVVNESVCSLISGHVIRVCQLNELTVLISVWKLIFRTPTEAGLFIPELSELLGVT